MEDPINVCNVTNV